jgi:hypothetical protein
VDEIVRQQARYHREKLDPQWVLSTSSACGWLGATIAVQHEVLRREGPGLEDSSFPRDYRPWLVRMGSEQLVASESAIEIVGMEKQ